MLKIAAAVKQNASQYHHAAYERLAFWSDSYGPRLWGTPNQEAALIYLKGYAVQAGLENVALEPVSNFSTWWRGQEKLTLYDPRPFPSDLKVIGLPTSVSCNVTGEVVVVTSWEDLEQKSVRVSGKIVVFNQPWVNYSQSVDYRLNGAGRASKFGAIAALIRSATPFSLETPHTGNMRYNASYPKIPAACITVEDAEMFQRMQNRAQKIIVNLFLENRMYYSNSQNLVAELEGTDKFDEIVLLGGHTDSWDVGSQTGANDDAGGVITCIEAVRLLKGLGLRPRRTIRVIGWSGEEFNQADSGAQQYAKRHSFELSKHVIAFEDDQGSTSPYGFGFTGSDQAMAVVRNIAQQYLYPINCTTIRVGGGGTDTAPLEKFGIPSMNNLVKDTPSKRARPRFSPPSASAPPSTHTPSHVLARLSPACLPHA